ncbi:hypothetical protein FDECE_13948 [Fusarium decemcellulare]|nr:hypothetical protein FDECE_13948 [Fusarium decemcellulare]
MSSRVQLPMEQSFRPEAPGHCSASDSAPQQRFLPSRSTLSLQATIRQVADQGPAMRTSRTWTSSSGDHGVLSDTDELEDRAAYVQEYNRLAKKHGLRILVVEDFGFRHSRTVPASPRKQGWLYRILRSTSSQPTPGVKPTAHHARHKRSVSDLAHSLVGHRRETPKALDLQSMVRLSGKSTLYLPSEHAPSALILPTSLRATAHHIAQHVTTRGIFRIPGSIRVVNALFDYYCCTGHGNVDITGTVRSANLPMHIEASVHDVASAFKRLLSVIPGGILGSVSLFDALVSIHSQLQGDPEFPRTKQTKVRARLIALAIATVESHFRRDLIFAVFGLLSLIGRVAEITPREDEEGRPLPTGDLMGYSALGIVFGPLLLGDLLGFYTMQLAAPKAGLLVLPSRSPKPQQDRLRRKTLEAKSLGPPTVDKIFIANRITEMLITNWRDVVRQIKSLGLHRRDPPIASQQIDSLEQDESESFVIKKPQGWDQIWRSRKREEEARRVESPGPDTPTLGVSRHRPRNRSGSTPNRPGTQPGIGVLSPTAEESAPDDETLYEALSQMRHSDTSERSDRNRGHGQQTFQQERRSHAESVGDTDELRHAHGREQAIGPFGAMEPPVSTPAGKGRETTLRGSPRVSLEDVPPRTSSKPRLDVGQPQRASTEDRGSDTPIAPAPKESISIERKNAIRKKHPERFQKTPRRSLAVEWSDPVTDPSGALATDPLNSQPTHREFSSEHEALEAALKAHSEELKRLGSPEYQNNSSLSHRSRQSSGSTYIETQSKQSTQQPLDMGMDKLRQSGEYTYSTDNGAIDRLTATRTRSLVVPIIAFHANNKLVLQFDHTLPALVDLRVCLMNNQKPSRCLTLPRQGLQWLLPNGKGDQRTRAASKWKTSKGTAIQSNQVPELQLRAFIGEEAALRAVELQKEEKQLKPSPTYHGQPELLVNRQTIPSRKPMPDNTRTEASLQNPPSLGTMIPYPEQPPIAQHVNFIRPSSSSSNAPQEVDLFPMVPTSVPTPIPRPGSTTTLHAQIRSLQRQLDLKTEEIVHLRRQLEVQEDADIGTLSQQLREAKREAQMWKDRAEAAERRIKVFERFTARLRGIREAAVVADRQDLDEETYELLHQDEFEQHKTGPNVRKGGSGLLGSTTVGYESDTSGRTEDAGVVTARIRKCLHGAGKTDGPPDSPPLAFSQGARRAQNAGLDERPARDISQSAVEIWMAAQELLHLDEAQGQGV